MDRGGFRLSIGKKRNQPDTLASKQAMSRTSLEEVCLTEVMTEVRVRERSSLNTGEGVDGRRDALMAMAIEMVTPVTPIAAETVGEATPEPMERHENRERRGRSEVPAIAWALGDWKSHMQHVGQQQACELAQLYRTIAKMADMLEMHSVLQETQWRGMKTWFEEKEEMQDAYYRDDVLWGMGIMDMVARLVAAEAPDQRDE